MTNQFKPNAWLEKTVNNVFTALSPKRGDFLSWDDVELASGVKRTDKMWPIVRDKIRRELMKRMNIAVITVHGKGYRLPLGSEQIVIAPKNRLGKAHRQVAKGKTETEVVPDIELTVRQRAYQSEMTIQMQSQHTMLVRIKHGFDKVFGK